MVSNGEQHLVQTNSGQQQAVSAAGIWYYLSRVIWCHHDFHRNPVMGNTRPRAYPPPAFSPAPQCTVQEASCGARDACVARDGSTCECHAMWLLDPATALEEDVAPV